MEPEVRLLESEVPDLTGRVAVVTGATSGIGETTARRLAEGGATVVLLGRNTQRGQDTVGRIRSRVPNSKLDLVVADLSLAEGASDAAAAIRDRHPTVDILVNNAGAVYLRREENSDGVERTWALNVLAPYRLTVALHDSLLAAGKARVVNVASEAHRGYSLDLGDLEGRKSFSGFPQYGRSKVALILLTTQFARRWSGTGVTFLSLHPGFVRTGFGLNNGRGFAILMRALGRLFALSPERGSDTSVFAATAPGLEAHSGAYLSKRRLSIPSVQASDPATGERLWATLERTDGKPRTADPPRPAVSPDPSSDGSPTPPPLAALPPD